jgi:CheY-like chemotaxis protein
MPNEPSLLHVAHRPEDRAALALAFRERSLRGVIHGVASAADALLFLNRLPPYATAPRPRLVVLDLALPRVSGLELLRILRGTPRLRTLPVVVLGGAEDFAALDACHAIGVGECIVKPDGFFSWTEVAASFDHWLTGSSSGLPLAPPHTSS